MTMEVTMSGWRRAFSIALFVVGTPAGAQDYPARPITLLVPFAAGGPTDIVARSLGQAMSKTLKQPIVVENAAGAGGTVAPAKLKNAAPDGYTLLLAHIGMSTAPALYRTLPFKPLEDFELIGQVVDVPMTLIAKKDFPPKDMKELITYVKANKDKVTYANAGIGAASHLCGMLLMSAIGADVTTVPYKGTGPAMTDLIGGQVDFMCDQTTNTTNQIKAGKVKVYAVTSPKRVPSLPDVPTLQELGLKGFEVGIWHALYAPKGTPKEAIDKLVAALQAAVKDPDVNKRFADLGATAYPADRATSAALQAHLKAEIAKWAPIIKKAGVYAD
jgi:tripartite-type tricarboxylate transporter receptor subunit TctC